MKRKIMLLGLLYVFLFFAGFHHSAFAKVQIKLGHDQPDKSPHHVAALKWKELVEQRTKGQVQVQLFPSQLMGSGTQMVEMLQAGAMEAGVIPSAKIAPLVQSVQVLDLPFLFPSREICYKVLDGSAGEQILKDLLNWNIQGTAFWESGFKQFTSNFPIHTSADFKGRKIRVMPAPVIMEQFKAFGATPVPIDFAELYNALQQGVVDGQENPLASIITMKFFEVQKHLTLSDHAFLPYIFMFSKIFLDRLPVDIRQILVEASKEAGLFQRRIIAEGEIDYLETIRKAGCQVHKLLPENRKEFEERSQPVHRWYAEKYGAVELNILKKEVERIQK